VKNEKWDILAKKITNLADDLCAIISQMEATNHADLLGHLKKDLEKYAVLSSRFHLIISILNGCSLFTTTARLVENDNA
jgi:hypothetical protein